MSNYPTLIFIPGAWHTIETWDKVTSLLAAQQIKCVPVTLPSTKGDVSTTLGDDVQVVRDAITAQTTEGRNVVVVAHSYGGAVGQSAIKGFTLPKGENPSSKSGHVIGLAFMASGFGQTGVSFIDLLGGKPPPFWRADPSGFAIITGPARELFYHDLPEEEGDYWVKKLQKQALKPLMEGGEHFYAGWRDVPLWYLATTDDKTYPTQVQSMVVQMANDDGGNITWREVESSHSPMLSKPEETAKFLLEAVAALVG